MCCPDAVIQKSLFGELLYKPIESLQYIFSEMMPTRMLRSMESATDP